VKEGEGEEGESSYGEFFVTHYTGPERDIQAVDKGALCLDGINDSEIDQVHCSTTVYDYVRHI
jgi:hypothetical protein